MNNCRSSTTVGKIVIYLLQWTWGFFKFCSLRWAQTYSKNREKFNAANIFYTDKYPEKQANYWGEKILGHREDLLVVSFLLG